MGRKPTGRPPGRPLGTPNERTVRERDELKAKLAGLGSDPVADLVRVGQKAEAEGDLRGALEAYKALVPFVYPKLAAVDVESPTAVGRIVVVTALPGDPGSDCLPESVSDRAAEADLPARRIEAKVRE